MAKQKIQTTDRSVDPYKHCHDGWPGITDQPWYKPLNTPEELIKLNKEYALECRPIRPDIHWKELREHLGLPPCTCMYCDTSGSFNPWEFCEGTGY